VNKKLLLLAVSLITLVLIILYYKNVDLVQNRITFQDESTWVELKRTTIEGEVLKNNTGVTSDGNIIMDVDYSLLIKTKSENVNAIYNVGLRVSPCVGRWADKAGIKLTDYPAHEIAEGQKVTIGAVKAKMSYNDRVWEEICIENVKIIE
jgi:hypothetical protein